jgi:superfamily I DNA/RNA helicase
VVPEGEADVVVSTVHKAKGREWSRVRVADDFSPFRNRRGGRREIQPEDVRLFYVAVTRAREEVAMPRRLRLEFGIRR